MNRIYMVNNGDANFCIGAENRNKARLELMSEEGAYKDEYINYRASLARVNGKPVETETYGFIDMKEYMEKGLPTWWLCDECESEDCFEYVGEDEYKCKKCGYIGEIPYER